MSDFAIDKFDKERFGLITGSTCSVLFPKKSDRGGQDTYAKKLATQKYFRYYDEVSTWQTDHGNFAEHDAFEYYQSHSDSSIQKGCFKKNGEWGGTCDALGENYGVDFKCPTSLDKFLDYLYTGIDEQQYNQAQMYMFLFDKPLWKIAVYLTETFKMSESGLTYPVAQDKRMIIVDVVRSDEWEQKLRAVTPKIVEEREKYFKILESSFGSKTIDYADKIARGKELQKKVGL